MKKENIMFGLIGLLIGSIIGFMFANSVNRSSFEPSATAGSLSQSANSNPTLPPDHPPIGASDGQPGAAAIQQVSSAIEKAKADPQNFEAQMTAADLYYQIQRFEEAAKFYEAASKLKPNDAEPLVKAGNAYFDSENYLEAEKRYTEALAKDPKDVAVRTDLGLTFYLREPRDLDRAIKEYKTSLAINPKHEVTLQNLVVAYREKGDAASLQKASDELRAVNPNNPALQKSENQ
jgi:tetratricopeptide (TPR) repeat protein